MTTTQQQPETPVRPASRATTPELQHRVEQFYYAEAELLDDHRYEEWITLFTEDSHYWIPTRMTRTIRERDRELARRGQGALVADDYDRLRGRVRRVTSGIQWSEEPPSRTRRLLTNIRVDSLDSGELEVKTNFWVYRSRLERHQDWFVGERTDLLRPAGDGFAHPYRIADRTIVFEQTTVLAPSISIFL
ncbi:aromatic-ring-hydroxylating dioxygenase subunit beta [Streptomyces sp. NPDC026665]|uniref:aromatic-ring-hydroxylating dioxygenase subunit beta n=1 Tax=Streptomyces sp. NPDC026665 TaxID=3154798 RepID=UPI003404DF10